MSKTSSNPNKLLSNTLLWTFIAPTPPNKQFALGRITSLQVLPAYQNLSPLPTDVALPTNATTKSTCFVPVTRIPSSLLLRPWKVEGSYSFDATPVVPPGTKVLVHLNSTCCKSWSFHASNGWYIGPSLKHYCCVHAIMEGTGGKHLTDTFCFKHHAMAVPVITPTNQIIAATQHLTAAISGVQESPPDILHAIATLHHILLGKTPPVPVPIDNQPIQPLTLLFLDVIDKEPVHIWDPLTMQLPPVHTASVPTTNSTPKPTAPGPAIIVDNNDVTPLPCQVRT
jgi:hypothetical protein